MSSARPCFGGEQLKNKDDPFVAENRRVKIVNTGNAGVAEGKLVPAPEPGGEAPPVGDAPPQ